MASLYVWRPRGSRLAPITNPYVWRLTLRQSTPGRDAVVPISVRFRQLYPAVLTLLEGRLCRPGKRRSRWLEQFHPCRAMPVGALGGTARGCIRHGCVPQIPSGIQKRHACLNDFVGGAGRVPAARICRRCWRLRSAALLNIIADMQGVSGQPRVADPLARAAMRC